MMKSLRNATLGAGILAISAILCIPSASFANGYGNGTVVRIAGQMGSVLPNLPASIYFALSPAPTGQPACVNASSYQFVFDPTTSDGKALYAALLTAKATGKSISVYGTGTCTLGQ